MQRQIKPYYSYITTWEYRKRKSVVTTDYHLVEQNRTYLYFLSGTNGTPRWHENGHGWIKAF